MPAPYLNDTDDIEQYYIIGYESGTTWRKDNPHWQHLPGGPHFYNKNDGYNGADSWNQFCLRTERRHHAWKLGWKHGALEIGFGLALTMPESLTPKEINRLILHVIRSSNSSTPAMLSRLMDSVVNDDKPDPQKQAIMYRISILEKELAELRKII